MSEPFITIIDDDESLRTALVGLVRSLGYEAGGFGTADAFLAARPLTDCIVTDIHMPGLSGIDLQRELTRLGDATPVIMITARTEPGLEQRARESGALCVLKKPFEAAALADCLQTALAAKG